MLTEVTYQFIKKKRTSWGLVFRIRKRRLFVTELEYPTNAEEEIENIQRHEDPR